MVKTTVASGGCAAVMPISSTFPIESSCLATSCSCRPGHDPSRPAADRGQGLFVNQSALTGEAMPAEKSAHACGRALRRAFDLPNVVSWGQRRERLRHRRLVRTGAQTYFG